MARSRFRELSSSSGEQSSRTLSRSPPHGSSRSRSCSASRSRTRSRSRSRGHSRSRRGTGHSEAAVEEAKLLMETDIIKFCDTHKLDLLVSSCVTCRLVSRSVGRAVLPELIRLMKAKAAADSDIPSAAEHYAVGSMKSLQP